MVLAGVACQTQTPKKGAGRALPTVPSGMSLRGPVEIENSCINANPNDCLQLAQRYIDGNGAQRDLAHAARLYRRACDRDLAVGCMRLGEMHTSGQGAEQDSGKASEMFARAYELGDPNALGLWQHACETGVGDGCTMLANRYLKGDGMPKDRVRGMALLANACSQGDDKACPILGSLYESGSAADIAQAVTLYTKQCNDSQMWACQSLADLYGSGRAGSKSTGLAIPLWERVCGTDVAAACMKLASSYAHIRHNTHSHTLALHFAQRACELGDTQACELATQLSAKKHRSHSIF